MNIFFCCCQIIVLVSYIFSSVSIKFFNTSNYQAADHLNDRNISLPIRCLIPVSLHNFTMAIFSHNFISSELNTPTQCQ
uniref:Uncharacterized protein n=1 Tax=Arundo donax TaxID=35708 RepID=A0A0A9CXG0_ARUDO